MTAPDPLPSATLSGPLRVAVVVDSLVAPRWVERILARVAQRAECELALVAVEPASAGGPRDRVALLSCYRAVDDRLFRARHDALELVDVAAHVDRATVITSVAFECMQSNEVELDVVLWLARRSVPAGLARCARYGVWFPAFAGGQGPDRELRLFWEVNAGSSSHTVELVVERPDGASVVASRSHASTDPISLYRNLNAAYWRAVQLVLQALGDARRGGWAALLRSGTPDVRPVGPAGRTPSSRDLAGYAAQVAVTAVRRQVESRLFEQRWVLGYRRISNGADPGRSEAGYTVIAPPEGRFFADPFLLAAGGRRFLFLEDYSFKDRRASISAFEIEADGTTSGPQPALVCDHHVSYPFAFVHDGTAYMIPETSAKRRVELYRAVELPHRWQLERVLLDDLLAVDATLLHHDDRFWLFVGVADEGGSVAEDLHVFWSESLFGEWRPHAANPVVSNVRSARPAGRILRRPDGVLIRPGQDCSGGYGRAVVLNQIDVLSETEYAEHQVGRIDGSWLRGNIGTHSYDRDAEYEVLDGRTLRYRRLHAGLHRFAR